MDTGENTSIAGRISQISDFIPDGEDFFLINSDTIFDFDINSMYEQHKKDNSLVTLSSVEVTSPWGIIYMKERISGPGEVVGFDRKRKIRYVASGPDAHGLINSGLAYLNKDALKCVDLESPEAVYDFESVLYSKIISMGRLRHYQLEGIWFPIDTPKDLSIINGNGTVAEELKKGLQT
jgi:glucose-1-phosphate cytidylyltransferase